ncbi:MAG: TM2 domain-containing protein [Sphingopyxis sp.]
MTNGFGRRGLANGVAGASGSSTGFGNAGGFGVGNGRAAPVSSGSADDMSPELRAFLAAERSNRTPDSEPGFTDVAVTMSRSRSSVAGGARKPRSMLLAYVFWYFASGVAAHRFYLGATQSAIIMLAMFWGGLATMLIFPPLGLLAIVGWLLWVLADLFLIPGLCRRDNEGAERG